MTDRIILSRSRRRVHTFAEAMFEVAESPRDQNSSTVALNNRRRLRKLNVGNRCKGDGHIRKFLVGRSICLTQTISGIEPGAAVLPTTKADLPRLALALNLRRQVSGNLAWNEKIGSWRPV